MNKTIISWANASWNPVRSCTKVSEGCTNCYAERLSLKHGWTKKPWTKQNEAENVAVVPHKLREPYKLKEPSRVFVNSMSDLFHALIPDAYRDQVFAVMSDLPQHVFQILTKRPQIAAAYTPPMGWPPNVWMGTSIEDARVIHRLDALRQCPAHVRFVSAEPLIGPWPDAVDLTNIDWLIVGGESGAGFRTMPHAWARAIRDLCLEQEVRYFFKQSSAYRTELGTSLRHDDGSFWSWRQFPDDPVDPQPAAPHQFAYE